MVEGSRRAADGPATDRSCKEAKEAPHMSMPRALLAVALCSAAGCECNRPSVGTSLGELNFVFEQGGVTITAPDGDFSFGKVAMGTKKTIKVTIENRGQGALDLESAEKVDGAATEIAGSGDENPVFTLA